MFIKRNMAYSFIHEYTMYEFIDLHSDSYIVWMVDAYKVIYCDLLIQNRTLFCNLKSIKPSI